MTSLAERIINYGYSKYPNRFYAQINALSTIIPKANSPKVQNASPDSMYYFFKLLSQHPRHIGFQMISSVSKYPTRVDNARICPAGDSKCIMEKRIEIALTYKPYFIEYWHENIENPEFESILRDVLKSWEKFKVGKHTLEMIHTPNHTIGSVCILMKNNGKKILFSGDTVFTRGRIGWFNTPTCNIEKYKESLKKLLKPKPNVLLPSHGTFILSDATPSYKSTLKQA